LSPVWRRWRGFLTHTCRVLSIDTALPILFALFFGFGFSSSSGQIMYAHIKERMPLKNAGTAMTGINFFTMIGVAFFLHGLGWVINERSTPED
jgi:fucose permease